MQTIGERLEEARKRKGISIREASEATKIRSDYLQKFETNSFEINLPDIYVRGFLRTYAQYLKLNAEKLLTDFAGLGIGEARDPRRHPESREIIGRLDLPEASRPAPTPGEATAGEAPGSAPSPRSVPTSVVTGAPSADRRQKFKASVLVGGAILALVLIVVVIRAVISDPGTTVSTNTDPAPAGDVVRLIALDNVHVTVTQAADKQVVFSGDLMKGDSRFVSKNGKVSISYNPGRNLQVEVRGQRFKMTAEGSGQNSIP